MEQSSNTPLVIAGGDGGEVRLIAYVSQSFSPITSYRIVHPTSVVDLR